MPHRKLASLQPPVKPVVTGKFSLSAAEIAIFTVACSVLRFTPGATSFTSTSREPPPISTVLRNNETVSFFRCSSFVSSGQRMSMTISQASGTMLEARPPSIMSTLKVVSASIRPYAGKACNASAASIMALIPFSGSRPAWALLPFTVSFRLTALGDALKMAPG